jgi:hypothetical protein
MVVKSIWSTLYRSIVGRPGTATHAIGPASRIGATCNLVVYNLLLAVVITVVKPEPSVANVVVGVFLELGFITLAIFAWTHRTGGT